MSKLTKKNKLGIIMPHLRGVGMNKYLDNFKKYEALSKKEYEDFTDLINAIDKVKFTSTEEKKSNAIIVMGFSGNGKTTYVRNFLKNNPNYTEISMDKVVRDYNEKYKRNLSGYEMVEYFGIEIEKLISQNKNIIIDGNFLNLLTRMALTDTLHEYNYNVNLLDITDNVKVTLQRRIEDVTTVRLRRRYPCGYTTNQLIQTANEVIKEIEDFYAKEKKSSFIDLQKEYKVLDYGVDKYLKRDASTEELISIKTKQK